MSLSIICAGVWVLLATGVALLPMRMQFVPGFLLLLAAPVLIGVLAYEHGAVAGVIGLAAFVSMFRNPLRYYWRKWTGAGKTEGGAP